LWAGSRRAYADRVNIKGKDPKKAASHTTPVNGRGPRPGFPVGLFSIRSPSPRSSSRQFRRRRRSLQLVAGLGILAIFCQSLLQTPSSRIPMTWALFRARALALPERVPPSRGARAGRRRRRRCRSDRGLEAGRSCWAPHTDDGEFGCGGTMTRLVDAGCEVRYVAFSIATRSLPDGFAPDTLAREVREATAELGIPSAQLRCTTSTCARSPSTARTSSSCSSACGGVEARGRLHAVAPRRAPGSQDGRRGRPCARSNARRFSATRSRGTTSTSRINGSSPSRRPSRAQGSPPSRSTRRSSTAATRTPSTFGTLRAPTAST